MSRFDPRVPPQPVETPESRKEAFTTGGGVRVIVHDHPFPAPEPEEPEEARLFPDAIIVPEGQLAADRDAFIAWIESQWGGFIEKELSRRKDVARASTRDLHQTVLIILCNHYEKERRAGKPGKPENVPAFLGTVIDNAVKNHARKKARRPQIEPETDVDEGPSEGLDPERAVLLAELERKVAGYRDKLSPEEAEVFEAREVDGMTLEMIAATFQRPCSTVADQYDRAKEKLRQWLRAPERGATLARGAGARPATSGPAARRRRPDVDFENRSGNFPRRRP